MFKKTSIALVLAAASFGALVPVAANAQQYTVIRIAPPEPMQEVAPQARHGYVWAPGYYDYRNDQYAWQQGSWVRERAGYDWQEPRWVERNGEWRRVGGDWQRRGPNGDRDGDGITNREERQERNAGLRSNGDFDRDGVRNKHDRFPRNPNRR